MSGALAARLTLARGAAWALLLAGWIGLGALALARSADLLLVFGLVAAWLLALGGAAVLSTRDGLSAWQRRLALLLAGGFTASALLAAPSGWTALLLALPGWGALTALASGVVRSARLRLASQPAPPVLAAGLGALAATLAVADPADATGLSQRLALLVLGLALLLAVLQPADDVRVRAGPCRAGLFDCSLPAWPRGAWHDLRHWPTLLAGLGMLPMMAALPAMTLWCRSEALPPPALVALHLAAMFLPALLLRATVAQWPAPRLAATCAVLLAAGAAAVLWARAPWDMLGVTLTHGAAWSLAWAGQLWSPQRRGEQGSSPWRAALGYALLTLVVGVAVAWQGPAGLALVHAALGGLAGLAWAASPWLPRPALLR